MKEYRVVWSIKLEKIVKANSAEEAIQEVCNLDCQHDGVYLEDSFEIEYVQEEKNGGIFIL
jgi:hypothetical protein